MHSVIRSAKSRRTATAGRITLCAQRLTDEHELDGFTMDDLAEAAGVSRRTLFNYFPGKVDAVLGPAPELDPDRVAEFRAGGPHHDLLVDLRALIIDMLEDVVGEREVIERGRRILRSTPRLMIACHERYELVAAEVVEHIAVREGPLFGALRARVAVTMLAALLDASLDAFLADDRLDRPFTYYFDESLRAARSLLGA